MEVFFQVGEFIKIIENFLRVRVLLQFNDNAHGFIFVGFVPDVADSFQTFLLH